MNSCRSSTLISFHVQEVCYQYWPEVGQATYGSIDVSPGTECCVGDMITRNLRYKDKVASRELS